MTTITTSRSERPGLRASWAGLALTAPATLVPLIDIATSDRLTDHVRAAYPDWSADLVAGDRDAIATYLAVVGLLGLLAWASTILGIARRKSWSRAIATTFFVLGGSIAAFDLTYAGGDYSLVIPRLYGLLGLLPAIAGVAALVQMWRRSPRT
ncbi:hypothetical protein AB0L85_23070 [Streptomyces sp. NPDC052051]|uniref:hypothetical protein n=1 Tax=Streptomyces sp. NPDC052051 TaxID=3154649 RepID=UPI0034414C66